MRIYLSALLVFLTVSSFAKGADRFALAVGPKDSLVIFGPNGQQVAQLAVPTISSPIKIGDTSFMASYGRDANDLLTVILTPDPDKPQNLHFNVQGKNVDTDNQAVVTLTYSRKLDHVSIDPGYLGVVQVDSNTLRRHQLADETNPAPPASASSQTPLMARATPEMTPREVPPTAEHAAATTSQASANKPSHVSQASTSAASTLAPPMGTTSLKPTPPASSSASSLPSSPAANAGAPTSAAEYANQGTQPGTYPATSTPGLPLQVPMATKSDVTRLYWSEPVTAPNGQSPPISIDEMKLIEVHGSVTVAMPNGATKPGVDGMVLPSGASVLTGDNASAAVFIGGVDSARLLPNTNVGVTHNLSGDVRHTKLNLRDGTVFSRVGRRPGETEDYSVTTPDGVAAARGTNFAVTVRNNGGHDPMYIFVLTGSVALVVDGNTISVITGNGQEIGMGSFPVSGDEKVVLKEILEALQPFNFYLDLILAKLNNGSGDLTPRELAYFNQQLGQSLYIVDEEGQLIVGPNGILTPYEFLNSQDIKGLLPPVRRTLDQIFGITPPSQQPVTPS